MGVSKSVPEGVSEGESEGMSGRVSEGMSIDVSEGVSKSVSAEMSVEVLDDASVDDASVIVIGDMVVAEGGQPSIRSREVLSVRESVGVEMDSSVRDSAGADQDLSERAGKDLFTRLDLALALGPDLAADCEELHGSHTLSILTLEYTLQYNLSARFQHTLSTHTLNNLS